MIEQNPVEVSGEDKCVVNPDGRSDGRRMRKTGAGGRGSTTAAAAVVDASAAAESGSGGNGRIRNRNREKMIYGMIALGVWMTDNLKVFHYVNGAVFAAESCASN